jgi:hypothetical protein
VWNGNAFTEVNVETTRPKGVAAPHLTSFRKVLKGQTFKRGRVETRGRPQAFTAQALRKIDQVRKDLIKKAKGEMEVFHGTSGKDIRTGVRAGT